jgi:RHS repeat-associated protein
MFPSTKNTTLFWYSPKPNFEAKSSYPFGSYPKQQISDLVVLAVPFSIRDILSSVSKGDGKYRYSFNGMKKDNELKGEGNSLDFGARIYDSRLGRWMSVDLLMQFNSNYSAMGNNPILLFDIDGNWVPGVDDKGRMFLIAEKGDNAKTLIQFYNNDMVFFKTNFKSWHRTYKPGEIQLIENNTTESKAYKHAKANPNIYKIPKDFFDTKYIKNYNGFAFANMVSNQLSFENNWRTTMSPSSFDNILK